MAVKAFKRLAHSSHAIHRDHLFPANVCVSSGFICFEWESKKFSRCFLAWNFFFCFLLNLQTQTTGKISLLVVRQKLTRAEKHKRFHYQQQLLLKLIRPLAGSFSRSSHRLPLPPETSRVITKSIWCDSERSEKSSQSALFHFLFCLLALLLFFSCSGTRERFKWHEISGICNVSLHIRSTKAAMMTLEGEEGKKCENRLDGAGWGCWCRTELLPRRR